MRAVALGLLVLLLQIPLLLISNLAEERRELRDQVGIEIGEKWGHRQTVIGPYLEIPYQIRYAEDSIEQRFHRVLPHEFTADGKVDVQLRSRGIFSVPVYTSTLALTGSFEPPEIEEADQVFWDRATLVLAVDDPTAIQAASALDWQGESATFEPGERATTIVAKAPLAPDAPHSFALTLELAGTEGLFVVPVGEQSTVTMESEWPHPSFQGSWLPDTHDVTEDGFSAQWHVTNLARGFPTEWGWHESESMFDRLRGAAIGVELSSSVDHYVMSERSTEYAILFFCAVFGVLWVLELRGDFRLHPIHYLLTGAALCSFHLLILAFAEHLGFGVAYGLAAGMVTLLLLYYAHGALRSAMGAASVGATCMAIYGYLYVCLANEDHALLFGAIGVFVGIAMVMVLTRRFAWVAPALDPEDGEDGS